jgi:signal transduction histidine kinase
MLRSRLFFWLLPLLILVVGTALYAISAWRQMAGTFQQQLRGGYEAELAGERLRADAGRMDLDGFKRDLLVQAQSAAGTTREPSLARVDEAFQHLLAAINSPAPGATPLAALSRRELALRDLLTAIDQLERFNYAAAQSAQERASQLARQSIRVMLALILGSVLIGLGLAWRMLRSQRTTEATLNSTPDPLFVVSRSGKQEMRNPAAEELIAAGALTHGFPEELAEHLRQVWSTGRHFIPTGYDYVVSLKVNGEVRHFLPRILVIGDRLSGFGGAAVLLQDVTKFRLLDDAKNNLVGTVSHELKTPLTSLRMAIYLLLEDSLGPLQAKQRELLDDAKADADRLLRILTDLLDLARLESGVAGLNRQEIPVERLLQDAAHEMRPLAGANHQSIELQVASGVGTVAVDPDRIRHVFINLLSNAVKYAGAGTTITIYAEPGDAGFVRCGVRDQGPGVPAESVGMIFEKFYRLPGELSTGAGLGLAIAREIVLAHGGSIACTSSPGQGSDFHFLLPGNSSGPAATNILGTGLNLNLQKIPKSHERSH